jgi:hypothetical protein
MPEGTSTKDEGRTTLNHEEMIRELEKVQRRNALRAQLKARYPNTWHLGATQISTDELFDRVSVDMIVELGLPDETTFTREQIAMYITKRAQEEHPKCRVGSVMNQPGGARN